MAVTPSQDLPFDEDDLDLVLDAMDAQSAAAKGWINFSPEVEPGEELPPRNFMVALFSARGDAVPFATWSSPETVGGRATIGIEHGSGPKALARLAERELPLPPGWLKVADHPRRGLVVTVPGDAASADVLWWLLTATHVLSVPPLTGSWLAKVYRPS